MSIQNQKSIKKNLLQRIWAVLMTPVGERVSFVSPLSKKRRTAPHGSALMMVIIGIMLMMALVVDFNYNELIRYKLASHERDTVKAQALASSGVNMARLLLGMQAALQPMLSQLVQMGIPLPAQTVWQLIPLESDLLKGMISGELQGAFGIDVSEQVQARKELHMEKQEEARDDWEKNAESAGNGPFIIPESGFGAFTGSFEVKIEDEERKAVSLRGWQSSNTRFVTAQRLMSIFKPERYDFLFEERNADGDRFERAELVANIYDWIDANQEQTDSSAPPADWGRLGSGIEDSLYLSNGDVQPKNEYFDSHAELKLVKGMSDAHMKAFADSISIYGDHKINILSAPAESVEALLRACAQDPNDLLLVDREWLQLTVQGWFRCKSMGAMMPEGCTASPKGFIQYLSTGIFTNNTGLQVNQKACLEQMSVESKNFTIKSTGIVGNVSRTMTLVMRVHGASEEIYYYSLVESE